MLAHIRQQIRNHLRDLFRVHHRRDRRNIQQGLVLEAQQSQGTIRVQHRQVGQRIARQSGDVGAFENHGAVFVQASQSQQILDQVPHARGLGFDSGHYFGLAFGADPTHARQFGVTANRRRGGAQFVRGIGHEATQLAFRKFHRRESLFQVRKHDVERLRQRTNLGGGRRGWHTFTQVARRNL